MKHATRTRKARPRSSLAAFGPGVQAAFPSERNTSHFLIVLAVGLGGAALAGEAYAGCNGNATQTIGQVDYGYTWSACWGDSGVDDKDEKNGDPGASITINTQASYTAGASLPYTMPWDSVGGVIMTYTMGGAGVDEGTAGAGGAVTITNYGPITLTTSTDPGSIGSLISATSFGGSGDGDNDNYKSNGGAGGSGGSLTITNYGALSVESLSPNTARGMAGIHAVSKGGTGGNQNSGAAGDQFGGVGGSGGSISITNTGQVNLGSATNPLNGLDYVWGLAAESIGQAGGARQWRGWRGWRHPNSQRFIRRKCLDRCDQHLLEQRRQRARHLCIQPRLLWHGLSGFIRRWRRRRGRRPVQHRHLFRYSRGHHRLRPQRTVRRHRCHQSGW